MNTHTQTTSRHRNLLRVPLLCVVAFALGIGSFAAVENVTAQDAAAKKADTAKATKPAEKSAATKVSEDGFAATRAMHAARVAIFNGDTKLCSKLLSTANDAFDKAVKDEEAVKVKNDLIPIDGSLALADTFVPSDQKADHIAKANEHFKNGKSDKGIQQLRLGEIEVNFSRVLMPLEATKKRLDEATKLVKQVKYYEANLALKAAEDGLVFDSVSLFEFPKSTSGTKATESKVKGGKSAKKEDKPKDGK